MCTQKPPHDYSSQLYERYREAFNEYIQQKVLPALREKHGEHMLRELVKRHANHTVMVRWLSRFFNYLDRYYITRHSLAELKDVGVMAFRESVYAQLKGSIKDAALQLVERERLGEQVDRPLVKNVAGLFVEMGLGGMDAYEADFEQPLLKATAEFYAQQAAQWVAADTCPEYMAKAEEVLRVEQERCVAFLHATSEAKLLKEVERELLTTHQALLLDKEHSGAAALLRDDKQEDLARMFRLYSRVQNGLQPVAAVYKKHCEKEGLALVKEAEDALGAKGPPGRQGAPGAAAPGAPAPAPGDGDATGDAAAAAGAPPPQSDEPGGPEMAFVRRVVELHDKHVALTAECWQNSTLFHKALKEAFEVCCNKQVGASTFAELLANFCDALLKKGGGSEKLSDEAVEASLDKVVRLLAYVSDKDLFAEFHRKKLAKRLLSERSASDDAERSLLSKLKQQCGAQFTSKLEGMVNDMALAKDMQSAFAGWQAEQVEAGQPAGKLDLTVTVLTTGYWPTYKFLEMVLPSELVAGVEQFKAFYDKRGGHRKLTWIYSMGTAHVLGRFTPKPIELVLNTLQAAILLMFNDAPGGGPLTYEEIKKGTNLPDEDLARCLASLACGKFKVLRKQPEGRVVATTDSFSFNAGYTDKSRRVRIPLPPVDEKKKVTEDVDKDRRWAVDAAIVRVMKSRKVVVHNMLVTDVTQQLSNMFKADVKLIKKRIEDLITREYIKRDETQANTYQYLA